VTVCRAAVLSAPHGPLAVDDLPPLQRPGPDEVLLAMRLAPINPADRLTISGDYALPLSFPMVLGAEGVGEVIAVGEAVSHIPVGALAVPLSRGNWTSLRLLPAADVIRVPVGMGLAQAAMLRINPATAWRLLDMACLPAGSCVVQSGGSTAVARMLARLGRERGCKVISIVRQPRPADDAEWHVLDDEHLPERVAVLAGGLPVRAAFDCVAGETSRRLAQCLAPGGRLIVYGHLSGQDCRIPSTLLTGKDISVAGFSLRRAEAGQAPGMQGFYDNLAGWMMRAAPAPSVAATLPLSRLDEALALAESNPAGRVMLALDR
jgi:NADPH:quinone reductase-like Zn-dependent oxidoreductase